MTGTVRLRILDDYLYKGFENLRLLTNILN